MRPYQFFLILGLLAFALAAGMSPVMVPAALAIADSSSQSPPRREGMPSSGMQSMEPQPSAKEEMKAQSSQGDVPIHISPMAIQKIQEQLSRKGFKVGNADGIWGSSTASGIKEFQKSQGLVPTGKLDIETIQSLNIQDIQGSGSDQAMQEQKGQKSAHSVTQVFISPSQLKSIQQSLKDQGYDPGKADGIWGSKTQKAISAYQQDKGMEPTGFISVGMLENMGMSQEVAALGIGSSDLQQQTAARQPSGEEQARGYFAGEGEQPSRGADQTQGTGAPLYAGSDLIRQVQQALKDAGEDPGEVDGKWNAETQKALERFEQSQNMTPSGTLTIGTLQKLVGSGGGMDSETGGPSSQPMPQPMQQDSGQETQQKSMEKDSQEKQQMDDSQHPGTQKQY